MWFILLFHWLCSSSLCNRLRDSASDLPVPLVPVDRDTERLIWEKDEEVIVFSLRTLHGLIKKHSLRNGITKSVFFLIVS